MELCDKKHDEVCYETRTCPACDERGTVQDNLDRMEEDRDMWKSNCDDSKDEAMEAAKEIAELQAELTALKVR